MVPFKGSIRDCKGAQRLQYPLIKEYTLNHIGSPYYNLRYTPHEIKGYRSLWGACAHSVFGLELMGLLMIARSGPNKVVHAHGCGLSCFGE